MIFNTFTISLLDSPELIFSLEFIQYKLSILFQEKESKPKVSFLVHFYVTVLIFSTWCSIVPHIEALHWI